MSSIDFSSLNAFDYVVFTIVILSTLFAFFRGFIHTVLSFLAWIGSIFVATFLFPYIQPIVAEHVSHEVVANILAFLGIYFTSLIVITIANYQILSLVSLLRLGAVDKSLGFAFGLARGVVIVTLIFMGVTFFISIFGMRESDNGDTKAQMPDWLADAQSFELLRTSSAVIIDLVPDDFWKDAKDYTEMLNKPMQPKAWQPEMDSAVSSVVRQLPEAIRGDILGKYKVENWGELPPEKRRKIADDVVDSYRRLLASGDIQNGISEDALKYLDKVLHEAQPSAADLQQLRTMFANPAYNGKEGAGKVMEDISK